MTSWSTAVGALGLLAGGVDLAWRRRRQQGARHRVARRPPPSWFVGWWRRSGVGVHPDRAWRGAVAAGVAMGVVAVVAAPWLGAVGAAVALAMASGRWARSRAAATSLDAVVAAAESMAATVRAGGSLHQAVVRAGSTPGEVGAGLRAAAAQANQGMALDAALARWADRGEDGAPRLVAHAVGLAAGAGGSHAAALDAVAATLRERMAVAAEVRAMAAQARLSAAVLAAAPVAFLALVSLSDPRVVGFLIATPAGWACLVGGAALDLVGAGWMAKLVRDVA